jgi:hypothetical protein
MKAIFEKHAGGTVLFLGRVTHFSPEELENFLLDQGMCYADTYTGQEITLLVLSTLMTPHEEQISYDLYDAGVPDVTLAIFEQYYTAHIKPQTLLMSLKLSNDQLRLRRLLGNEAFADTLFLKLFSMVDWEGEGILENDANRDVTISFVKRFFQPDGFRDPAMIYAPTTVMIIAKDSADPEVLEAILTMPNHEVKISRYEQKKPKSLREMVAFNPHIGRQSIRKLLSYRQKDCDYFLSSNPALSEAELMQLYARADVETKQMMTHNEALPDSLFDLLIDSSEEVQKSLLRHQPMTKTRIEKCMSHPYIHYLGANPTIAPFVSMLLALDQSALDHTLASNPAVNGENLEKLYRRGERVWTDLASNPNLSTSMAERLFALGRSDIIEVLCRNSATPRKLLDQLCEREDPTLNRALASNPSVDIYWLRQFQLDTSLLRILAGNPTYGEHILRGLGI